MAIVFYAVVRIVNYNYRSRSFSCSYRASSPINYRLYIVLFFLHSSTAAIDLATYYSGHQQSSQWLLGYNYDTIDYVHTQCGKNVLYISTCIHVHACTLLYIHSYTHTHVPYIHVHTCTYTYTHVRYMRIRVYACAVHAELMVSLFIRCTMRWAQPAVLPW